MKKFILLCALFAFTATILPRAHASPVKTEIKTTFAEKSYCIVDAVVNDPVAVSVQDAPLIGNAANLSYAETTCSPNYNFRAVDRRQRKVDRYYKITVDRNLVNDARLFPQRE